MQRVDLLGTTGPGPVPLEQLDLAVGERLGQSTQLFVRGHCLCGGAWLPFAGVTWLREGRDDPDHDLRVYGGKPTGDFRDDLAVSIHLALDVYAGELVAGEMRRICDSVEAS